MFSCRFGADWMGSVCGWVSECVLFVESDIDWRTRYNDSVSLCLSMYYCVDYTFPAVHGQH